MQKLGVIALRLEENRKNPYDYKGYTLMDMRTDCEVLGLASCHSERKEIAGTAEWPTPISPDQMGVFVGSGPK